MGGRDRIKRWYECSRIKKNEEIATKKGQITEKTGQKAKGKIAKSSAAEEPEQEQEEGSKIRLRFVRLPDPLLVT